jgi:S-formylglutathione hydrolase FrmB
MRTLTAAVAACAVVFALACAASGASEVLASGAGTLLRVEVPAPSLAGNLLGDPPVNVALVWLPPSYDGGAERYPVLYFLPGFGVPPEAFFFGYFQGLKMHESLARLAAEGSVCEMILVMPTGQHSVGGSFYVNSPVTGGWEDFLVKDLVSFVDGEYRTIPSRDARAIAGHSMGGYGALHLAMRHPDLYCASYALSPGLFAPDGLSRSQMFANAEAVGQYLDFQTKLSTMGTEDALAALRSGGLGEDLQFTICYGMAFSPDVAKPPYVAYPYGSSGPGADPEIWNSWAMGFGGVPEGVPWHTDALLSLESLVIDYGENDEYPWIVTGCKYLSAVLTAAGVPHESLPFDGGHENRLRERIEQHMLPAVSAAVCSVKAR